jgi:putative endonuclease
MSGTFAQAERIGDGLGLPQARRRRTTPNRQRNLWLCGSAEKQRRRGAMSRPPPGDDSARRRTAHLFGLKAESVAAVLLTLKGYSILARRYAANGGEIDLIARRGRAIAFVEVKARPDLDAAAFAISATKRRRIARAARAWLARNPWAVGFTLRGDAVFVARGKLPRHAPAAYRLMID